MILDEMIERENRLIFDSIDPGYHRELVKALTELKAFKEIVTCKNCKYNDEGSCEIDGYGVDDDYFCASGRKRG